MADKITRPMGYGMSAEVKKRVGQGILFSKVIIPTQSELVNVRSFFLFCCDLWFIPQLIVANMWPFL